MLSKLTFCKDNHIIKGYLSPDTKKLAIYETLTTKKFDKPTLTILSHFQAP